MLVSAIQQSESPMKVKSDSEITQLCLTLCDYMDCSLPGSSIHGIFQARVLEWVAISFSRDLPNPGIVPESSTLQAGALPSEPPGNQLYVYIYALRLRPPSYPPHPTPLGHHRERS